MPLELKERKEHLAHFKLDNLTTPGFITSLITRGQTTEQAEERVEGMSSERKGGVETIIIEEEEP